MLKMLQPHYKSVKVKVVVLHTIGNVSSLIINQNKPQRDVMNTLFAA